MIDNKAPQSLVLFTEGCELYELGKIAAARARLQEAKTMVEEDAFGADLRELIDDRLDEWQI